MRLGQSRRHFPLFPEPAGAQFFVEKRSGLRQHALRVFAGALEFQADRFRGGGILMHGEVPPVFDGNDFLVLGCPRREQLHRVGRGQYVVFFLFDAAQYRPAGPWRASATVMLLRTPLSQ